MKILIVSFDKALTDSLTALLSEHEVFVAKNAEEAITLSPKEVDLIIFDAISGAISEDEINQLYEKKFKDSKYVVLYDELFPVDPANLHPTNKVLIKRDLPPEEIIKGIFEEKSEKISEQVKDTEKAEVLVRPSTKKRRKILIVSFDKRLTDSIEERLKDEYDIEVVKNMKSVKEKGKEAGLIIFDAISGTIAEKNLNELSADPEIREKPFLILIDELFPIDVDKIDLEKKDSVNRDAPIDLIIEKAKSLLEEFKEEEKVSIPQPSEIPEISPVEEVMEEKEKPKEESPITHTVDIFEEMKAAEKREAIEESAKSIKEELSEKLSEEKFIKSVLIEAISSSLYGLRDEVKKEISDYIRDMLEAVIREELDRYFKEAKISEIIREETRKIVEEKLKELLS